MADPHAQLRARLQTEGDAGQVIHDFLNSHANGDGIFEWVRIRRQLAAIHAAHREGRPLAEAAIPVLQLQRAIQDQTAGSIFSLVRDHAECRELYELFKAHFEVPAPQATGFHTLSSTEVFEQIQGHREYEAIATSIVSSLDPAILQAFLPHHVPPSAGAENPHSARTGNSDWVTPGEGAQQLPGTEQLRERARLPREREERTMGGDDRSGGSSTASALAQAREEEGSGSAAAAARSAGREVAGSDAVAALTTLQHASWLSSRDRGGGDDSEGRANSEEEEGGEKLVAQEEPDFGGGGDLDYDNANDDEVELANNAARGEEEDEGRASGSNNTGTKRVRMNEGPDAEEESSDDDDDDGEEESSDDGDRDDGRASSDDDDDDDDRDEAESPAASTLTTRKRKRRSSSSSKDDDGDDPGETMTLEEIKEMGRNGKEGYHALQAKCKALKLDAKGKTPALVRRLIEWFGLSDDEAGEEKADSSSKWFGKNGMYALEFPTASREGKLGVKVIIGAVGLGKNSGRTFNERVREYHCNEISWANVTVFPCYEMSPFCQAVLVDVEECFKLNGRSYSVEQTLGSEVFLFPNFDESAKYISWIDTTIDKLKSEGKFEIPRLAHEPNGAQVNIFPKSPNYCQAEKVRKEKNKAKREAGKIRKDHAEYEKKKKAFNGKSFEKRVEWIKQNGKGPRYTVDWRGGGAAPAFVTAWARDMRSKMSKKKLSATKVKLLQTIGIYTSAKSANNIKGDESREKKRVDLQKFQAIGFRRKRPSRDKWFKEWSKLGKSIESDLHRLKYNPPTESFMKTVKMYANEFHLKEFKGKYLGGKWVPTHPFQSSVVSCSEWNAKHGIEAPPEKKSFRQCICGVHDGLGNMRHARTIICAECASPCRVARRCAENPTVKEEARKEEWRCPDCEN